YDSIKDLEVRGKMRKESRKKLQQIVEQFRQKCLQWKVPEVAEKNPELKKMFDGFLNAIKGSVEGWNHRFQDRANQEAFEDKFRDKFIVFIYGKVKAGKSTLGNFIVNNRPTNQNVEFCVYDSNSKEQRQNIAEFATNITECTSEIQLFELGGLVWVDTPGLGSITKENGALAKRYVEAADFVLYPTNSSSYMQNNEINEISELLSLQKPVHILITRSDRIEEDEDENGKIIKLFENKTENVRKEQERDALERLHKKLNYEQQKLVQSEILSISVEAAKQGLEKNDLELFRKSNLPKFYEQFNMILREKAQNLKNQSPLNSIIGLINVILGDSDKPTKESLAGIRHEYEKLRNKLEEQRRNLEDSIRDLRNSVPRIIAKEFDAHRIDKNNYRQQCKEIRNAIDEELRTKIAEICSKTMRDFATDFCKSLESIGVNDVQDITITREIDNKKPYGQVALGALGAIAGSFIPIPGVGTLIGGAIGVAAGSILGSFIGDKLDSSFAGKDIECINVGDNLEETLRDFRNKLENIAKTNVDNATHQMDNIFFNPLKQQFAGIEKEILRFSDELLKLKREYEQKRS
ncbi:MAG: 50S ribosome-binding GTPase, partial [Helicobacter sp.]|nr:50S ribosome-binding GTPase [Helicobacter sp.]